VGPGGRVEDVRRVKGAPSDFVTKTPDLSTGEMKWDLHESKGNQGRLTENQKRAQAEYGERYKVDHINVPNIFQHLYDEYPHWF